MRRSLALIPIALAGITVCFASRGLAEPKPQAARPGIPDWVRVINDAPLSGDRKGFAPGDVIPVVVGSTTVMPGEVFPIRYEITLPDGTKSTEPSKVFDRFQMRFEVTADHIGKAFGLVLRVNEYSKLSRGQYTVRVFVDGFETDGSEVRMPESKTHEFRITS